MGNHGLFFKMSQIHKSMEKRLYLKAWRVYRDLTQERVAGRTSLDTTQLSRLENGKLRYNQRHLEDLANAYACDPRDLFYPPPNMTEAESEFERFVRNLDVQKKAQALSVMRAMFDSDSSKVA